MKPLRGSAGSKARFGALLLVLAACDREAPNAGRSAAPRASAPAPKPNACASGGGTLQDPARAAWFSRTLAGLCIDPHADFRSFGDGGKAPLGAACETLEGECASYERYGLRRVVVVPYVSADDPRARITVKLLELASPDAAYALFVSRLLGDSPEDAAAWKRLNAAGTAQRAGTKALAWRAQHLALLDYADETSAPGRAAERGAAHLEALATDLVARLPGKPELPRSVALLPDRDAGPAGVRYEHEDIFGVAGLGAGAIARYAPGGKESPLAVMARDDEDSAKDVLRTLGRLPSARSKKGAPYDALTVSLRERENERRVEWLFGRKRNVVLGIGREPAKLGKEAEARVRHAQMLRLKSLLDDLR
ncbi:MAG TPA: DUF6599 family protein [Polyangiaceae bacterium]